MPNLISLVQPNFQNGPTRLKVFYLPYSVGCVWAYAASDPVISKNYKLNKIIWRREPVEQLSNQLADDDIVVFSTYIWNRNYNFALARQIKNINPKTVVIFGGPEPAVTDKKFFEKHPYIDYVIKGEGEQIFHDLLLYLTNTSNALPTGLLFNDKGYLVDTGNGGRIVNLAELPSPYLTEMFDQIVFENPDVQWQGTIETNRGCPYQCTFCDWGSLTNSKVKHFPLEKVLKEIEWIGKHCQSVYITDANFGMFIERDRVIVDKLVETHRALGTPDYVFSNWAKNQKSDVIELIKKLSSETSLVSNGLTVSVQSMTPEVLDIIKRTNLKQHKIQEIFQLAEKESIQVYTELILGLPGETVQSFKNCVYQLIQSGNHHGIQIFQCQLLENTELNQVQREIYDIKTQEWQDIISPHQKANKDLDREPIETIAVVTETSTMSQNDIIDTMVWISFMLAFHFHGFSTQISRFLNRYINEEYAIFYDRLYQEFCNDLYFHGLTQDLRQNLYGILDHQQILNPMITIVPYNSINVSTGILMRIYIDDRVEYTYNFLKTFLSRNYDIDQSLAHQLLMYQREITLTHDKTQENYQSVVSFDFDFVGFINQQMPLHRNTVLKFTSRPTQQKQSFSDFLENFYFRQKQQFGVLTVTSQR